MACTEDFDFAITVNPPVPAQCTNEARLSFFDDGAGEYLANFPVSTLLQTGDNGVPFFLPSPLVINKRGLVTVTLSNVDDTNMLPLNTHMCIMVAIKKAGGRC